MTTEELALQEYENIGDDKLFPNHTEKDIWVSGFKTGYDTATSSTRILLYPVNLFERRRDAEYIENSTLTVHQLEAIDKNIMSYNLSDFMDFCNDQEFDIENYWVSYIQLIT